MELEHVSFCEVGVHFLCFAELSSVDVGVGFPKHNWEYTALKEITHLSSFARASEITLKYSVSSDETPKIPLFRRASCGMLFSSSQAAISSYS